MTGITVSIWHNVARDKAGRHTGPLDGFTPGDPLVRVFTYQTQPRGRLPEVIAEDAFALANGHPRDPGGMELSRRYYERRLRSLSFPGKRPCCPRSCCVRRSPVLSGSPWTRLAGEINADLGTSRIVVVLPAT
jgi:hypothetical protein